MCILLWFLHTEYMSRATIMVLPNLSKKCLRERERESEKEMQKCRLKDQQMEDYSQLG